MAIENSSVSSLPSGHRRQGSLIYPVKTTLAAALCLWLLVGSALAIERDFRFDVRLGPRALGKDLYQMAIWLADPRGEHLTTLFVTNCVGREGLGNRYITFLGAVIREAPEALPVWAHARGVRYGSSFYPPRTQPLPDAITGATPKTEEFTRTFHATIEGTPEVVRPFVELNVSRDKVASLVFSGEIALAKGGEDVILHFAGFGDAKGKSGALTAVLPADLPHGFVEQIRVSCQTSSQ